jgi:DNA-binding CsgD family transcriptional regulator
MLSEEKYRDVVDAIYEAALDPTLWRRVVDRLTAGFQAIGASMYTPVAALMRLEPVWATDADPEFVAQYASNYAQTDILAEALMRRIPETSFIYSLYELVSHEAMAAWDGYRDLLKPRGVEQCVGLVVNGEDHRMGQLMVYLPELPHQELEDIKRTMSRFERHFAQAMRLHWHLSAARDEATRTQHTLDLFQTGVAWLSESGKVLYRNAEMDRLLALEDGLALTSGNLQASTRAETELIQEGVQAAQRGEERSFAVGRRSDAAAFRLRAVPLPMQASALRLPDAVAIAFVSEARAPSAASAEAFALLYGLSPAERRILEPVAAGASLRDAAEKAGIGYETARSHFKSILAKSNVNRHADLIRLLATIPAAGL